jgi:ActR/RegA family two-component response regulator
MTDTPTNKSHEVDSLLGQLSVVLDDIVSLVSHGDFLIGEAHRLIKHTPTRTNEKPSLLLVDDEELVLKALVRGILKEFLVKTTATVEEAIELLRTAPFDAVISDFRLEEGNGIDILRIALREQPNALRILHTGEQSEQVQRYKKGHLVQHLLAKPCDPSEITALLKAELGGDE